MERKIKKLIKDYEIRLKLLQSTLGQSHADGSCRGQIYALENVVQDLQQALKSL